MRDLCLPQAVQLSQRHPFTGILLSTQPRLLKKEKYLNQIVLIFVATVLPLTHGTAFATTRYFLPGSLRIHMGLALQRSINLGFFNWVLVAAHAGLAWSVTANCSTSLLLLIPQSLLTKGAAYHQS